MPKIVKFSVISHVGNSRNNNEDNFLLPSYDNNFCFNHSSEKLYVNQGFLPNSFCCAVSDGMGGHVHGEVASLKTIEYLSGYYENLLTFFDDKSLIADHIAGINNKFCDFVSQNKNYKTMGATLCGVIVKNNQVLCFNVGDSRLYTFASGKLKQITVDHSEGQRLFDLQLLTADELKTFPNRKAIYRYIGQKTNLIPDLFEIESINDCTFLLLCTDGLTDALSDIEIEDVLNTPNISIREKSELLLELALKRNLNVGDNITIMLIGFEE